MEKIKLIVSLIFVSLLIVGMLGSVVGTWNERNENLQWSNDIRLTNSLAKSWDPKIVINGDNSIHVVFVDNRDIASGHRRIFHMKSIDSGNIWTEEKGVVDMEYDGRDLVCIALGNNGKTGRLDLGWKNSASYRGGGIFYQKSVDGGETWIGYSGTQYCLSYERFDIAVSGNDIYEPSQGSIPPVARLSHSHDGGDNWSVTWFDGDENIDIRSEPAVATFGSDVYLVWDVENKIYYLHSGDKGYTWEDIATEIVNSSGSFGNSRYFLANSDNLYLLYSNNEAGNFEIYYKRSRNRGFSWDESIRLTNAPNDSLSPRMALDSVGNVHIVWDDNRSGDWEIYYKVLDDDGNVLISDTRLTNNQGHSWYPQIAIDNYDYCHVVWQDDRDGNWEIYYKRFPNNDITPPSIYHTPITSANVNTVISVNATITDNFGIKSVFLYLKNIGDANFSSISMNLFSGTLQNGTWKAEIPPQTTTGEVYYYIETTDGTNRVTDNLYTIRVNDTNPPIIYHTPIDIGCINTTITISANIVDDVGVESAILYYNVNGSNENFTSLSMIMVSGDMQDGIWIANISSPTSACVICYYIEVTDGVNRITDTDIPHRIIILSDGIGSVAGSNTLSFVLLIIGLSGLFALLLIMARVFYSKKEGRK